MNSPFRVGIIRVLTTDDQSLLNEHGRIIEQLFPDIVTVSRCIPDQPNGIHSPESQEIAVPKVIALAKDFAPEVDMLVVSCCDDPGVAGIRALNLPIPVAGAGECSAALAARFGGKIALLGITDYAPEPYLRIIPKQTIGIGLPDGIHNTRDLLTPEGKAACMAKAMEQKKKGADAIVLACTGLATIHIAPELEAKLGIPVIDPVIAEGLFVYFEMLRRKLAA